MIVIIEKNTLDETKGSADEMEKCLLEKLEDVCHGPINDDAHCESEGNALDKYRV